MPELIDTLFDVIQNMEQYWPSVTGGAAGLAPNQADAWYYIPSLSRVGPSRFIGYKNRKVGAATEPGDGGVTEKRLKKAGWFRPATPAEEGTIVGLIHEQHFVPQRNARFNVLKDDYDQAVFRVFRPPSMPRRRLPRPRR